MFGGHRESGESYLQCVVREILEETSYYVSPGRFTHLVTYDDVDDDGGTIHGEFFVTTDIPVDRLVITEGTLLIVLRIAAAWSPKTLGGQLRAFDERAQLQPRTFRMTRVKADEGSEAAIGASDDALSADDIGESLEPLRDQLGMLDTVGLGVRDRSRLAS